MSEIAGSVGVLFAVVAIAGVPIALVRVLFGRADLSRLYRAEGDGWPGGVQEEEPQPWQWPVPRPARDGARRRIAEDAYAARAAPLTRVRVGRPERSSP